MKDSSYSTAVQWDIHISELPFVQNKDYQYSLISRGSTDIYVVDICTVYGSSLMSFFTVCRWVRKFSPLSGMTVGFVSNAHKSDISESASSPKCVKT